MKIIRESFKSKNIYDFLVSAKALENINFFYFWIIDIKEVSDIDKVFLFFEEMFFEVVFLKYEDVFLMFYFEEVDFEIENIINSIADDFSIKLKIYSSSKVNTDNENNFFVIYDLYKKYLKSKTNYYMTNIDLVNEIIRHNINDVQLIKPVILKNILDDSQIENLIKAMFGNNLNVTKTASVVYMHRNTVIRKLEYIKRETGLNIQKFLDADIMYWLLKIK